MCSMGAGGTSGPILKKLRLFATVPEWAFTEARCTLCAFRSGS